MRLRATVGVFVGVALPLVLAACSEDDGSDASAEGDGDEESIFTYTGDDRDERLVEGATAEGTVTWYTSLAGPVVAEMTAAFEEAYPDISVEVFRAPQTDLVARVVQELSADRIEADVFELTSDGALVLSELGVSAPFYSPYTAEVPDRWKTGLDGDLVRSVADRASYVGFSYNTDLLDESDVPEEISDLANPELAGKLALATSTTGVRWIGSVLHAHGEEEGRQVLEDIAQNDVRLEAVSGAALAEMIAAGEVVSSPGIFRNHAFALQDNGEPIEWVPLEPVTGNIGYVMVAEVATNPNAAVLFADFLIGPEGTQIKEGLHYPPPYAPVDFEIWVPDEHYDDVVEYEEDFATWQPMVEELFGG